MYFELSILKYQRSALVQEMACHSMETRRLLNQSWHTHMTQICCSRPQFTHMFGTYLSSRGSYENCMADLGQMFGSNIWLMSNVRLKHLIRVKCLLKRYNTFWYTFQHVTQVSKCVTRWVHVKHATDGRCMFSKTLKPPIKSATL